MSMGKEVGMTIGSVKMGCGCVLLGGATGPELPFGGGTLPGGYGCGTRVIVGGGAAVAATGGSTGGGSAVTVAGGGGGGGSSWSSVLARLCAT
jgi:hypothetical protein